MSISIPRKLIISIVARQDARGAYGKYLMERQETGTASSQQLNLSGYMAQLAIDYTNKSQQKTVRSRYFQRQYQKIMRQCRDLELQIEAQQATGQGISNEIHQIENEITALQTELVQMKANWNDANGNCLPGSTTSAMTISDITNSIDSATSAIKDKNNEKNNC